jgi:predicted ABC-type ATPase
MGGQIEPLPQEQELEMTSLQAFLNEPTQRSEDGIFGIAYTEDSWTDLASEIMENQPPEIQEKMAEAERKIREGTQSIEEYRDPETGEWNPERRALHERIIQGVMKEAGEAPDGEDKQIWVTGGLPGAGKSGVLEHREAFPEGTIKIDSDRIKAMLPEYEGWNATLLHEESSAIVQELFRRSTTEGRNIVYDATLKTTEKAEELIAGLENMDYGVNVIYVDIPMAMSMERAIERFATQGGRYVSPMYIATHDSKNVKTLATLRDSVSSWEHWDNSQPAGQEPTLMATGGRETTEGETDALQ